MSVPLPERDESDAEFVFNARKLAAYTVSKCVNAIPKRYTFYYGQKMAWIGTQIYMLVVDANSRWATDTDEAKKRLALFCDAHSETRKLIALIELADESVHFDKRMMREWMEIAAKQARLLKGVIKSERAKIRGKR